MSASQHASEQRLTDAQIEQGWRDTFSTNNPFCPCDLKTFTKAARWAEANIRRERVSAHDELVNALQAYEALLADRVRLLGTLSPEMAAVREQGRAAIAKATGSAA